jgi:PRTRC genetic system protein C
MAIKIGSLPRNFYLNGHRIADPNPNLSIEEVRAFHTGTYPELNNSTFTEETTSTEHKVVFSSSVGHKG